MQGRFSGRLETKEDEKKLHDECKLLGPLVGGVGKRGEKNRMTLAKIVRAISSGDVRKHCEERENRIHVSMLAGMTINMSMFNCGGCCPELNQAM